MSKALVSPPGAHRAPPLGDAVVHWWREVRAMTSLAGPLVGSQLAAIALITTDVVMMGWLGPEQLAAGTLASSLYIPALHFGFGVVAAVAPMAAQALGAHDFRGVRRSVRQGLWVAVALGVVFGVLLWYGRDVLLLLGQQPETATLAQGYLRAALWGLGLNLALIVLRSFLSAHGRPRAILVVMLLGVAVNAAADYALMFGRFGFPRLELVGAGIATSLVNVFMFAALFGFIVRDRRFRRYYVWARLWRPDWPRFLEVLRLGTPMGLTVLAETGLFAAAANLMGLIGTAELAAHAIALQCASVAFMVPLGIAHAVTVRVALAAGARNRAGIGRAGWVALGLGAVFMSASAGLFWFGGAWLSDLFLDLSQPGNPAVAELAVAYLAIAALFQIFDGAQVIGVGALRGLKDTRVPMWLAVFGYWGVGFTIAVLLAFPLGLGGEGVWIGLAAGLATVAVLLVWRFHRRERLLPGVLVG